jgi:hypothetical protein
MSFDQYSGLTVCLKQEEKESKEKSNMAVAVSIG